MIEAFVLGLSSGTACLATCGVVLFPVAMYGQYSTKRVSFYLLYFLSVRLLVYLLLGVIAAYAGNVLFQNVVVRTLILGIGYIVLSVFLFVNFFWRKKKACPVEGSFNANTKTQYVPIILGLVSGLNLCPPLLIAFTESSAQSNLLGSLSYFVLFFLGTAIYFIPIPFLGKIKRKEALKHIGKIATIIISVIIFYKGLSLLGGFIYGLF